MWSLPLVRLPTAEVVASAGGTVSATYCRSIGSLALMASLLPPIGGWGQGPIRSSACPEAITAAVWPPGAEVVVAAGAEVVDVVGGVVKVVHSCENGARVPLVRECNDICLRAKCNNICTQDFSLGNQVVRLSPLDGGFKY
jgi:hypothetical protein